MVLGNGKIFTRILLALLTLIAHSSSGYAIPPTKFEDCLLMLKLFGNAERAVILKTVERKTLDKDDLVVSQVSVLVQEKVDSYASSLSPAELLTEIIPQLRNLAFGDKNEAPPDAPPVAPPVSPHSIQISSEDYSNSSRLPDQLKARLLELERELKELPDSRMHLLVARGDQIQKLLDQANIASKDEGSWPDLNGKEIQGRENSRWSLVGISFLAGLTGLAAWNPGELLNYFQSIGYSNLPVVLTGAFGLWTGSQILRLLPKFDWRAKYRRGWLEDQLKHIDRSKTEWSYLGRDFSLNDGNKMKYDLLYRVTEDSKQAGNFIPELVMMARFSKAFRPQQDLTEDSSAEKPDTAFQVWKLPGKKRLVERKGKFYIFLPNKFRSKGDYEYNIEEYSSLWKLPLKRLGISSIAKSAARGLLFMRKVAWRAESKLMSAPEVDDFDAALKAKYSYSFDPLTFGSPMARSTSKAEPLGYIRASVRAISWGLFIGQFVLPSPAQLVRVPSAVSTQTWFAPKEKIPAAAWLLQLPTELAWPSIKSHPLFESIFEQASNEYSDKHNPFLSSFEHNKIWSWRRSHDIPNLAWVAEMKGRYSELENFLSDEKAVEKWISSLHTWGNNSQITELGEFKYKIQHRAEKIWLLDQPALQRHPLWPKLARALSKSEYGHNDLDLKSLFQNRPDLLRRLEESKP